MNKPSDHPAKIRYKYQMDENARLQTAHGVWGGINPQGEIEMNFYHESDALPAFSEQLVAPDGSIGHEMTPRRGGRARSEPLHPQPCAAQLPHGPRRA